MPYPRFLRARQFKKTVRIGADRPVTSTTYAALDTALDIVLPAAVNDVILAGLSLLWGNETPVGNLDVLTVGGSNYFSSAGPTSPYGAMAWRGTNSVHTPVGGTLPYVVQAADIVSGKVTFRLMTKLESAGTKNILNTTNSPIVFWVQNIGPAAS